MSLDLWLLGVVGLFGVMGLFSGAIKQVAQWLAMIAAYVFVRPAVSGLPVHYAGLAVLATILVGGPLLRLLINKLIPARALTAPDRVGGLLLGSLKGAALVYVCLCVTLAFEGPLSKSGVDLAGKTKDSRAVEAARRHNLFDRVKLPALQAAQRLAEARSDPRAAQQLLSSPAFQSALNDPALKAALSDPALKEALNGGGDPARLFENPQVKKLLEDPKLAETLAKLETEAETEAGRTTHGR
jgi:hypothetical protein